MNFHMNVESKIVEICNNVKLSYLQIGTIVDKKKSCETCIYELFVLYLHFFYFYGDSPHLMLNSVK